MKCWNCGVGPMREANYSEYKKRKIENANRSLAKAKERGTRMGRPKIRNDERIKELREKGLSIREIAYEIGMSTAAVQRGLK